MKGNNKELKKAEGDPSKEDVNERITRSLNKSKRRSLIANGIVSCAFILMILPVCAMITFIYYGYGMGESRGNEFVKVIEGTIAITEPNAYAERIIHEVGVFSMTGFVDKIGSAHV